MAESDTFAARLRALMAEKRTSFAATGEAVGVSAQAVHKWANGGYMQHETLRRLADYLEVDWLWLRYGDEVVEELRRRFSTIGSSNINIDINKMTSDLFLAISLLSDVIAAVRPEYKIEQETIVPHRQTERRPPLSISISHGGSRLSPSKPKKKV